MPRKKDPSKPKLKYQTYPMMPRKDQTSTPVQTFVPPTRLPDSMRDAAVERLARWAVREAYNRVQAECGRDELPSTNAVDEMAVEDVFQDLQDLILAAVNRVMDAGKKT